MQNYRATEQVRRTIPNLRVLTLYSFYRKKMMRNVLDMDFISIHECRENLNVRQASCQGRMHSPESLYCV